MRTINNFAIGIPVFLALLGFAENSFWGLALLSTILTGFIQVLIAIAYAVEHYNDRHIHYYFLGVGVFFMLWISTTDAAFIWSIPPILAIYLTYILNKQQNAINND
jgi:uncharacterized membrane protein